MQDGNAEAAILNALVPKLVERFDSVVIVPTWLGRGECDAIPGVYVNTTLAKLLSRRLLTGIKIAFHASASRAVWRELFVHLTRKKSLGLVIQTIVCWGKAKIVENWAKRHVNIKLMPVDDTVLYTFWFDAITLGVLEFGKVRGFKVVSSAHGHDLFEFRHRYSVIPFRAHSMRLIDEVYPDSDSGAKYLIDRYPSFKGKIVTALTGTRDPGFRVSPSTDGAFRLLSISRLHPVKRLDLIIDAVRVFAKRNPTRRIEWIHVGDGPGLESYREIAEANSTGNAFIRFCGGLSNRELDSILRTNKFDVFINSSSSEGTSAAIMEAMSVGLPIIATPVGGNVELVKHNNGVLLPESSTVEDMVTAFEFFADNPKRVHEYGNNGREIWERIYNADVNCAWFSQYLMSK